MQRLRIITLVDITRSNCSRTETDKIKIGQQSNFNTIMQTIGIRSNIEWEKDPTLTTGRLPDPIEGKANHWIWEFSIERDYVFQDHDNPVGLLEKDLHNIPIISNLTNTVDLTPSAFQTLGNNKNTWIEII